MHVDPFIDPHPNLTPAVVQGLGWFYLLLFVMNTFWCVRVLKRDEHVRIRLFGLLGKGIEIPRAAGWAIYASMLAMASFMHFSWSSVEYIDKFWLSLAPDGLIESSIDSIVANPVSYFVLSIVGTTMMVLLREWLVKPTVGWILLNAAILFMVLSMTDYDFRQIVGKPDNVPIVALLYLVGGFTWLYFSRAVENDRRLENWDGEGETPVLENDENEKVLVWPDLVYAELICMIAVTTVLIAWGIMLDAPLEEPASIAKTPNPSKAPWYFLGLQEMLVYYDPWLAGVVFPTMIIGGLMAIPYIDFNKVGNGYFVFKQRAFAVITFLFGFLTLWVAMIILGTFLRGPNWNIFGIYEYWDVHKLVALNNVMLSELFWVDLVTPITGFAPEYRNSDPESFKAVMILIREAPGFIAIVAYFVVLPPLMAATLLKTFFHRMGFLRYMIFTNFLLMMAALPLKMVLRWAFNLKYLVNIPEWFFNI